MPLVSSEAPTLHETSFAIAQRPQANLEEVAGETRCGDALMGRQAVKLASLRYALPGPLDNPDPHLTRNPTTGGKPSLASSLDERAAGAPGPTVPWGRETLLGTEVESANGNMWGDAPGESRGEAGLGRVRTPGGLAKRLEAAPLAASDGPRIVHTGLRVNGARKASEVGRTLAQRFPELSSCGEAAASPRRVELRFTIAPEGEIRVTSGPSDELERCLEDVLTGANFSAGAAATTDVVYPLHFFPARAALRTHDAPAPAPVRCDCG